MTKRKRNSKISSIETCCYSIGIFISNFTLMEILRVLIKNQNTATILHPILLDTLQLS